MGAEANLEQQCVALTKRAGGLMLKLLPWLVRGLPDRILLLPGGWIAFIELKAPEGRLTLLQGWWQRKLTDLGFRHRVVRTLVEFDAVLEEWRNKDFPLPECDAKQTSDQMTCRTCGLVWDMNDSDPPKCPKRVVTSNA